MTTGQSELVPKDTNPNETARRTQKIYEDILGRTFKTEVLDWNGSIYSTTVTTFNGRDQVTNTRQYAGSSSSTTFQDLTTTFDGHGRLKTRHYPIEDAQAATTGIYNIDDSVGQVIDPRNALKQFTYDARGLVTKIQYDAPANQTTITDSPTIDIEYDNLGNRTKMTTENISEKTYVYDSLSRLTNETINFDALTNNLTIAYSYHLGGGLKSITDPFSSAVNYTNDKSGKLTKLDGTPFVNNTTGNYADNIKYRAFGQIKEMEYAQSLIVHC